MPLTIEDMSRAVSTVYHHDSAASRHSTATKNSVVRRCSTPKADRGVRSETRAASDTALDPVRSHRSNLIRSTTTGERSVGEATRGRPRGHTVVAGPLDLRVIGVVAGVIKGDPISVDPIH